MFETMTAWLMVEHLWERTFDDEGEVGYSRLLARTRKPYRTLDGWMAILPYNDKHWRNFFELIGRPEVLKDPRYATLNARSLHINDMYAMVEALTPSAHHGRMGRACSTRRRSPTRRSPSRPTCSTTRIWCGASCSRSIRTPARARS